MYGANTGGGVVNVAMTGYAKGYTSPQLGLVVDILAPRVQVTKKSDNYLIFSRSNQMVRDTRRAPGAAAVQIAMDYSLDKYNCEAHAAEAKMPREKQGEAGQFGFSLMQKGTRDVMDTINRRREWEMIQVLKTGITNTSTPGSADLWDASTSDPIQQIANIKYEIKKSGVDANTLILSPDMLKAALENDAVIERFKYKDGGRVTIQQLATLFDVTTILEARSTAVDGANNADFLWKGLAACAYVQTVTNQDDLSAMKTFVDSTEGIDGYEILTWPDAHASKKTDWVSGEMAYDTKVTAQETIGVI
ncbi:major capsid protein [Granulicella cerasi]|uniref:Major capsid protein n=1 Tax=Granulicella cerasi TaxID=741063 RepID=A0ABW1Z8S4_9BACT|nr:major capsid protein [Granulicella cerasi]